MTKKISATVSATAPVLNANALSSSVPTIYLGKSAVYKDEHMHYLPCKAIQKIGCIFAALDKHNRQVSKRFRGVTYATAYKMFSQWLYYRNQCEC